ncbi:P-type cation-transporting ATPase [Colletotrichum aenigma]|uniref:P-type cation-transporting ATPase n=1 Tax=Colletotrichum aenigma TaxID=1215731 RepID=UPI001872B597|nr:P-type cation-transporting ATPase [Colletotrichum aenigma]KAF5520092.1 P-type cation-transporting ATPase [Colletotrichum aenigma]
MPCESGCCGPPKDPAPTPAPAALPGTNTSLTVAEERIAEGDGKDSIEDVEDLRDGDGNQGCCGSATDKPTLSREVNPTDLSESCQDQCCSSTAADEDSFGAEQSNVADDCKDGCCGTVNMERSDKGKSVSSAAAKVVNSCCDSNTATEDNCKKKCCGNNTIKNTIKNTNVASDDEFTLKDDCKKGCCGDSVKNASEIVDVVGNNPSKPDESCGPKVNAEEKYNKGCCETVQESKPVQTSGTLTAIEHDCCAPVAKVEENCKKGCCSSPVPKPQEEKVPSCCEGKTSPCCDSTCIDRLALRECTSGKRSNRKARSGAEGCTGGKDGKPCRGHARTVRETYQAKLEALGCICRALLALGQESCCAPRDLGSCADSCCGDEDPPAASQPLCKSGANITNDNDLERGVSGTEHVVLSISGMTCTGCETKLKRTLTTLDAIKNLKTSLVLARAEFDLDVGVGSADDVIKHLERTTEFKCEKITSQGASIDLLSSGRPENLISQPWPAGVTDIRVVDSKTVHVEFDAEVVGARDLVEKGWSSPMELAPPRADPTLEAGGKHVRHVGMMTLLSIILTVPVLVMAWAPLPDNEVAYGSASLALATIVQIAIAGPFYPTALKSLIFSRMIEMDLLIVLSTSAAYIFSVVSFGYLVSHKPLSTGEFFETSTLLVTLIMVGRYVGALARQKAVESISIRSLQVSTATIIDTSGQEKEIDSRLLQYGDTFRVAPESRIPTDGTVISGSSELDESMVTGESRVIEKYVGSSVIAGSINGSGTLKIRLTRLPEDNTISNIAGMVDEAKLSKPKIQDIADRVASYFVPVVVTLTIITFAVWIAVGVAVRKQSGSQATIQAVTYAITVLIVSCPCAIGLAVPMVIVIASGVAAEKGVIFKSANSIEVAYKTSHVVFDKTGTLTRGELSVSKESYVTGDPEATQSLLLGLVGSIKHPVSAAVAAHLKANGILPAPVSDSKTLTGKGVEGTISGRKLRAGNSRWLGLSSDPAVESFLSQGYTVFCFTVDGTLVALFALEDSVRPEAFATVSKLQASNVSVHILSGDDDGAVQAVASQLNIPEANVRSRCNPADKQDYIQQLLATPSTRVSKSGKKPKKPVVMFCGDGTNDAVALAQATIGVHMNAGTDVARSAADVVLMRPSLTGILTAIAVSRKAIHRIAFNFGWSFVYNLFAILLGSGAFVNARIPPEFAGLGELASVLPVIAAAVLLRWSKL